MRTYKDHTCLKIIEERDLLMSYERQKRANEASKRGGEPIEND